MKYFIIILSILFVNSLFAQAPIGNQFQLHTSINLAQKNSQVAMDYAGDLIAVWQSVHTGQIDIYGQRFDADGNKVGSEFLINTTTTNEQSSPTVACDSLGNFVVAWQSYNGLDWDIYAQRYDLNGDTVGGQWRVNTDTVKYQKEPAAGMDRDGNFVIAWQDYSPSSIAITMQRYDSDGNPLGSPTTVNTYTLRDTYSPEIAMNGDGQFVIAWQANYSDPDIAARAFDASGNGINDQVVVNQYTNGFQTDANVDIDKKGNFFVVWQSDGADGSGMSAVGRRYDNTMTPLSNEYVLSTTTDSVQEGPDAVLDDNGEVTVFWDGIDSVSGDYNTYYKRFDASDQLLEDETILSTEQNGNQTNVNVGKNSKGNFFASWEDDSGLDGVAGIGVFGRIFKKTAPVISTISDQTIQEGGTFNSIKLNDYVTDQDDDTTNITWSYSGNTDLTVSIDANNIATVTTPDSNWFGSENITFTATDNDGLSDNAVVKFEATAVNDPPVMTNISNQSILEGGSFTPITLDNYISDVDNPDNEITWSYSGNSELIVSITNRIATVSAPDTNWYGEETITFKGTDTGGLSDSNAVIFTVTAVNDPPIISGLNDRTVDEGSTFASINLDNYVNDVDNSDNEITWDFSGNSELGVSIVNRVATITIPDTNWYGSETITFTATDPGNLSDNKDVKFTVNNINDPPVVSDIPDQTIDEGQSFVAINLDNYVDDIDNADDEISWNYSGNTELSVNINPLTRQAVISIPNVNWNGSETITFTATDPGALSDNDAATFTVNSVNDPPVVGNIPDQTVDEGETFNTINLDDFVSDVEDLDSQIKWTYSGNSELSVSINGSRVATITTPNADWYGSETITFKATDTGGLADSDAVVFTMNAINDPPVVGNIPDQTIDEGQTFTTIDLDNYVTDVDNNPSDMTWLASGYTELSVTITNRVATITAPDTNWNGQETITFEASDPDGLSDSDSATFKVNAVNDAPVVSDIPDQSIAEGGTFTAINLNNYVSDVDNSDNEITWTYSGNTDLIVNITNNMATVSTPDINWNGSETITFTATDPGNLSDSDSAVFNVTSLDDPPIVTDIPDQEVAEGSNFATINLDDYVSDADNSDSEISWTATGMTDLQVSITNRVATITPPDADWNGSETITFTAKDPGNLSNSDTASFTVTPVNDAPVVSDIPAQTINEGANFTNIALDNYVTDVDNAKNTLTWEYSGQTELSVSISANRIATITIPSVNWNGSEIITFKVTDTGGLADSDTVAFTVKAVNDAPVVGDIPNQTIDEGGTFSTFDLDDFVTDVDNADSEISWEATGNTDLLVNIDSNNVVTVTTPNQDWFGMETITFTATDPGNLKGENEAVFTVNPINDAPVLKDIPDQKIKEGGTFAVVNLDSYVSDVDNSDSEIIWTYSFSGNNLSANVDTNRVLHVTPKNPDWFGTEDIFITATDPGTLTARDTVAFIITPVNDAPVIGDLPDEITFAYDSTVVVPLNGLASDVDSPVGSLIWSFESSNDSVKVQYDQDMNTASISAIPNFHGDVKIYATVTDDSMASDTDSILVHVTLITGLEDLYSGIPQKYELQQNFPNPFNPTTKIRFGLPQAGKLKIEVFNIIGQRVTTLFEGFKPAGYHLIEFDASKLSSGIYFYRIQAGKFVKIRKMILIK